MGSKKNYFYILTLFLLFFCIGPTYAQDCVFPIESPDKFYNQVSSNIDNKCYSVLENEYKRKISKQYDKRLQQGHIDISKLNLTKYWNELSKKVDSLTSDDGLNESLKNKLSDVRRRLNHAKGNPNSATSAKSAWIFDKDIKGLPPIRSVDDAGGGGKIVLDSAFNEICEAEGGECKQSFKYAQDILNIINAAKQVATYNNLEAISTLANQIGEDNKQWDKFLFESKPMFPQDLWATQFINNLFDWEREQSDSGLLLPPEYQWFFLHPSAAYSYVGKAPDGQQLLPSVYVEVLGVNKWQGKFLTGVSYILEVTDRAQMADISRGVLLTFDNSYHLGITRHKIEGETEYGLSVGIDLANFYLDNIKPKLAKLK